jgi:hypothetical protein
MTASFPTWVIRVLFLNSVLKCFRIMKYVPGTAFNNFLNGQA